jgi:hypothetical protein
VFLIFLWIKLDHNYYIKDNFIYLFISFLTQPTNHQHTLASHRETHSIKEVMCHPNQAKLSLVLRPHPGPVGKTNNHSYRLPCAWTWTWKLPVRLLSQRVSRAFDGPLESLCLLYSNHSTEDRQFCSWTPLKMFQDSDLDRRDHEREPFSPALSDALFQPLDSKMRVRTLIGTRWLSGPLPWCRRPCLSHTKHDTQQGFCTCRPFFFDSKLDGAYF